MEDGIIETNWGVGNVIDNKIYLNKHLVEFPELRQKVIRHEREHINSSWIKNRKVDALSDVKFKEMIPFFKKYPKTFFQQYLPVFYKDKTIFIEWSLLILYLLGIGVLYLIYKLIKAFSSNKEVFWLIIKNILITIPIVIILYLLGKMLIRYLNKQSSKATKQWENQKK